jgi:hypothetical protein
VWRADSVGDLFHPYLSLIGSPTTDWGVSLEAVANGFARAAVHYEPSLALNVGASFTGYDRGVAAPFFTVPGRRSLLVLSGFLRPAPQKGYMYVDGTLEHERTEASSTVRARVGGSVLTPLARLVPYARLERTSVGGSDTLLSYVGMSAFMLPRPQWGPILGRMWLRGSAELERVAGITTTTVAAGRDLWKGVRLEAGVTWTRNAGTALTLTLSSYLSAVRTVTTMDARPGQTTATQFLQGSVIWDRAAGRIGAAPGPSLQRAGVAGRVFQDENGDGRWQPGEPPVVGARIFVGTLAAVTDSSGAYRVWDLIPFEPVVVRVDSLSLDSPLLVPALASVSIVPGPNRFRALDVPIATAGVLEGRVVRGEDGSRRGIAGVTLMLIDKRTGVVRRFVTFSDGDFYLLGVIAGEYELRVDPRTLESLGMASDPLPITLAPTADGVGRSGIAIVLTPKN